MNRSCSSCKIVILITLLFIVAFSCYSQLKIDNVEKKLSYLLVPEDRSLFTVRFPVDYHVVSEKNGYGSLGFTDDEIIQMKEATVNWRDKTNNIVKINLIFDWAPPTNFNPYIYKDYYIKTVWKIDIDSDLTKKLYKDLNPFCGLSWGDVVIIVESYGCDYFKSTFTHELGHQIGLRHIREEYPSVMNPVMGDKNITEFDMLQFCMLYGCD